VSDPAFGQALLAWWQRHGRHDLAWQRRRTPYRVWVAEIMLQQTQAATVEAYFQRFMRRFPSLKALARADLDEVLAQWSGLGYYARARNLHRAAGICLKQHAGRVPRRLAELMALPGVGPSTANAIRAQAFNQRAPILDGNVKRIVARHAGIEGWPGRAAVARRLWQEADRRTPADQARDYTQAIMDLGATVCTPRNPECAACPVASNCVALGGRRVEQLPTPRPPRQRPRRQATWLILENRQGLILLQRRPPTGIWGGLWCLPDNDGLAVPVHSNERPAPPAFEHAFSHFQLKLSFRRFRILRKIDRIADNELRWMTIEQALKVGLPGPIRTVLEDLNNTPTD